jgi:hypothetical protein
VEVSLAEVGFGEVGFAEVSFTEVGFTEVGFTEVSFMEVGSAEVGFSEGRVGANVTLIKRYMLGYVYHSNVVQYKGANNLSKHRPFMYC